MAEYTLSSQLHSRLTVTPSGPFASEPCGVMMYDIFHSCTPGRRWGGEGSIKHIASRRYLHVHANYGIFNRENIVRTARSAVWALGSSDGRQRLRAPCKAVLLICPWMLRMIRREGLAELRDGERGEMWHVHNFQGPLTARFLLWAFVINDTHNSCKTSGFEAEISHVYK